MSPVIRPVNKVELSGSRGPCRRAPHHPTGSGVSCQCCPRHGEQGAISSSICPSCNPGLPSAALSGVVILFSPRLDQAPNGLRTLKTCTPQIWEICRIGEHGNSRRSPGNKQIYYLKRATGTLSPESPAKHPHLPPRLLSWV